MHRCLLPGPSRTSSSFCSRSCRIYGQAEAKWTRALAEHECDDPRLAAMKATWGDAARALVSNVVAEDAAHIAATLAELERGAQ